jgi:pimeloyl-ACP methyl ester carboxylesterase
MALWRYRRRVQPRQKWVTSRSHRIRYLTLGSGPPVVLLHGFSQSADSWAETGVIDVLAKDRQVVALDRLGHGGSDAPSNPVAYDEPASLEDITAVLDAEQIDRVALWGYSLGGRSAMSYAIRHPERVTALVQGSTPPLDPAKFDRFIGAVDGLLETQGLEALYRSLGETDADTLAHVVASNDVGALRASLAGSRAGSPDPGQVGSPWLFYFGSLERPGPSESDLALLADRAEVHVVDGAGHLECFDRGVSDVLGFVVPFLDRSASA